MQLDWLRQYYILATSRSSHAHNCIFNVIINYEADVLLSYLLIAVAPEYRYRKWMGETSDQIVFIGCPQWRSHFVPSTTTWSSSFTSRGTRFLGRAITGTRWPTTKNRIRILTWKTSNRLTWRHGGASDWCRTCPSHNTLSIPHFVYNTTNKFTSKARCKIYFFCSTALLLLCSLRFQLSCLYCDSILLRNLYIPDRRTICCILFYFILYWDLQLV